MWVQLSDRLWLNLDNVVRVECNEYGGDTEATALTTAPDYDTIGDGDEPVVVAKTIHVWGDDAAALQRALRRISGTEG